MKNEIRISLLKGKPEGFAQQVAAVVYRTIRKVTLTQ
jgi:hypothetical protein